MRRVNLQGAPTGTVQQQIAWLVSAVQQLSSASTDNDTVDIATNFSLPTFTVLRTIPASPSTTDLKNVLCTLLSDLQKGGSVRTG